VEPGSGKRNGPPKHSVGGSVPRWMDCVRDLFLLFLICRGGAASLLNMLFKSFSESLSLPGSLSYHKQNLKYFLDVLPAFCSP
jgi:hypothetical protein